MNSSFIKTLAHRQELWRLISSTIRLRPKLPPHDLAHLLHRSARKLADPVCSAFVQNRVFERVRANMHECSRKRVCALMQEFRKHQRGVLSAATGRGHSLQKIVEYSYGLRGQRKWAFHRAYNLSMHHNTVTGPPWPLAEHDERFGWRAEVEGQLMVMQTASPLPMPLLEHLHKMMLVCPRAERRIYEGIANVPRTPLVPGASSQCQEGLPVACDQSLGISLGKTDFAIVEVKRNRRSKVRFKRKTKIDRKFLTNGDLASVCKTFGRGLADDNNATEEAADAAGKGADIKTSVRAQLKDALRQLQQARDELQRLRAGVISEVMNGAAVQPPSAAFDESSGTQPSSGGSQVHAVSGVSIFRANLASPSPTSTRKRGQAAPPHPLAFIPGTSQPAAASAASSAVACSDSMRSHLASPSRTQSKHS